MQAIIMAAGKGSRLGTLTEDIPKSLLEIEGYKLIEYNIALLHFFGITDITIVTGYRCELLEQLLEPIEGIRLVFNPFYEMTNVLGSFYLGQEVLKDDFVYLHADTLCAPEIFGDMLSADAQLVLPIDFKVCDEEAMKIRRIDGRIQEINKTMPCVGAEGEFIGIMKIKRTVIAHLKEVSKELLKGKGFTCYFESAIQKIIDMQAYRVEAVATKGRFWGEVDFKEDFEYVKDKMSSTLLEIVKKEFPR